MARAAAARVLASGDSATDYSYQHIYDALRTLSSRPGQRKMVFISPGFIISTLLAERSEVIDRSTRAGIVIDTLDARGLYAPDISGDIADPPADSYKTAGFKTSYRVAAQSAQSEILSDFANGTGGTFYHNRNDLDVALREAIAAPSTTYVLGFSPQNLKLNGSFHTLKVSLTGKRKFVIQARRGFYAPRTMKTPEETAKAEIQEAVFSQEEIRDLPVDLQTQFFVRDATAARLSVLAHVDLKGLKFRKVEDRNHDDLTLATVIFDENGNYVTGGEKVLEMKLRDATLERLDHSGITVKSSFDVKPGNYLVRFVMCVGKRRFDGGAKRRRGHSVLAAEFASAPSDGGSHDQVDSKRFKLADLRVGGWSLSLPCRNLQAAGGLLQKSLRTLRPPRSLPRARQPSSRFPFPRPSRRNRAWSLLTRW